jgi:GNAT superfamily N-acetyltransferase
MSGDAEHIANLFTQLGYPTSARDVPGRLDNVFADGGSVVLAIDDGGRALGLMSLARLRVIHAAGPIAYITGLVIDVEARGQGVGRALVDAAKEWARSEGCVRLNVTSAEHRADAHAFYPKCGLAYHGRRFSAEINPTGE